MVSAKRLSEDVDAGMLHWRLEQLHKSLIADVHASKFKRASQCEMCDPALQWSLHDGICFHSSNRHPSFNAGF